MSGRLASYAWEWVNSMKNLSATETVQEFWKLMGTNDFYSLTGVLSSDFVLEWPQSRERIRGTKKFARMNQEYPTNGPWEFTINRIVGSDSEVVTDVTVTDGVLCARAISFFTVSQGKINRIVEFWPDPYEPHENRAHLVEPM